MDVDPNKYVVFKRQEFDQWLDQLHDALLPLAQLPELPGECKDSVVIRLQDRFAAPALDMYADSIALGISFMKSLGLNGIQAKRLTAIADYFKECSETSRNMHTKLPD